MADADVDGQPCERGILLLTGSVALDPTAKLEVKRTLESSQVSVLAEKLLPDGTAELDLSIELSIKEPVAALLVAPKDTPLVKAIASAFPAEFDAETFKPVVDSKMRVLPAATDVDKVFPPILDTDISLTASSESIVTPENEKRVFTFLSEPDVVTSDAEHSDEDDFASELPVIPKSPLPGSARRSSLSASSRSTSAEGFKARAMPSTTAQPSITPRMSRAAALRLGLEVPEHSKPRGSVSPIDGGLAASSPASARRPLTSPRSLAQPSVTPRQTKSSMLRASGDKGDDAILRPPAVRRQSSNTSERSAGHAGTPGYGGRRISVASTSSAPRMAPRTTKAAQMREQRLTEGPLPTKTVRRQSLSTAEIYAQTRIERRMSVSSLQTPSSAPRLNRASMLRVSKADDSIGRMAAPASHSRESTASSVSRGTSSGLSACTSSTTALSPSPIKPYASYAGSSQAETKSSLNGRSSSTAEAKALRAPAITPRPNKAAELRLAARKAAAAQAK